MNTFNKLVKLVFRSMIILIKVCERHTLFNKYNHNYKTGFTGLILCTTMQCTPMTPTFQIQKWLAGYWNVGLRWGYIDLLVLRYNPIMLCLPIYRAIEHVNIYTEVLYMVCLVLFLYCCIYHLIKVLLSTLFKYNKFLLNHLS